MRDPIAFSLSLAALLQCGCGMALAMAGGPAAEAWGDAVKADPGPPLARAFGGEIRDFATFKLEPGATLEFWSDDPTYRPTARLDGEGRFSIRIDTCLAAPGVADQAASAVFLARPLACMNWIGRFAIRARLGGRCSLPEPDPGRKAGDGPTVLWLRECTAGGRGGHPWRATKVEGATPGSGAAPRAPEG